MAHGRHFQSHGLHASVEFFIQTLSQTQSWHHDEFFQGNPSCPPKATPPRNKGLIRPYYGKPMVNKALFLGGVRGPGGVG